MGKSMQPEPYSASIPPRQQVKKLQASVLQWYAANGRDFPWRHTSDPFQILVAEILLRQTQAARVALPYTQLLDRYPDATAMARADVKRLRAWFKPLGLVARANRLIETAQVLVKSYGGQVPNVLAEVMALPGMGVYSARAVLCLAYDIQVPMVDEGSGRVIRRILDLHSNRPAYSDSRLIATVELMLPRGSARDFNLGLIDTAAIYCHSKGPDCSTCPLACVCGYGQGIVAVEAQSRT